MSALRRTGHILVVDDDPSLLRLLSLRLESAGHTVSAVADAVAGIEVIADGLIECVISDLRMDGLDGLGLLERLNAEHPDLPVILITAHGTIPDAVAATRAGALDFLPKPIDKTVLLARVEQALAQSGPSRGEWQHTWQRRLITRSPRMRERLDEARLVAGTDTSVLITGESGTGKEVLARVIHDASRRSASPFVAINCGAMPEQLLESELFGHEKGAFTDAKTAQQGLLRSAAGGTVLLDEIGDMPLTLQIKLLRVLQEREVRPVGGQQAIPIDVRILSATHRDLESTIADGHFRADLYYRLAVITLELPRLAERPEDIPPLTRFFLDRHAENTGEPAKVYAPDALERLTSYPWPGNIRQLSNVVEHNVALSRGSVISRQAVDKAIGNQDASQATAPIRPLAEARDEFVRDYLVQLLRITEGNVSQAARLAQRNRTEFYKLLSRHTVTPDRYKRDS